MKVCCDNCRKRKKKCDGHLPCNTCVEFKNRTKQTSVPDCSYKKGYKRAYRHILQDSNSILPSDISNIATNLAGATPKVDSEFSDSTDVLDSSSSQELSARLTNLENSELLPTTGLADEKYQILLEKTKRVYNAMSTSKNPYFSSGLPNFGNIYDALDMCNVITNSSPYIVVCDKIHQYLLDSLQIFANGRIDDGYKLLFFTYLITKKYQLFYDLDFVFPKDYPETKAVLPPIENLPERTSSDCNRVMALRSMLLTVDVYICYSQNVSFIIEESNSRHADLLTSTNFPVQTLIKIWNPIGYHQHLLFKKELDKETIDNLPCQLHFLRVYRKVLNLSQLKQSSYNKEELGRIIHFLHQQIVQIHEFLSQVNFPFQNLSEFVQPKEDSPLNNNMVIDNLPSRSMVMFLSILHCTAIRFGIFSKYSLKFIGPVTIYSSHDILILSIRALAYIEKLALKNECKKIHPYQLISSASMAYQVCQSALNGLRSAPVNLEYLQEVTETIEKVIYPLIHQGIWHCPPVSTFSMKIKAALAGSTGF
ncbi:hypothetical protein BC833DRAFT_586865, partial [Globomyces pollinis-pini]